MTKKSVFKKIAQFLETEKNDSDGAKIIANEESVTICPGESGIIYGYMLRNVYQISEVRKVDFYISSKADGTIYLEIY